MPTVFFITHPDVTVDPRVPVPDWPLNERGRARMYAMTARPWARGVQRIFASSKRKARDAAQVLADGLGLGRYSVIASLGEKRRDSLPETSLRRPSTHFSRSRYRASGAGRRPPTLTHE